MRSRYPLILAFVVSCLLHLGVVVSSGWRLPEEEKQSKPLEARLLQLPAQTVKRNNVKAEVHDASKPASVKHIPSSLPDVPAVQLPPLTDPLPAIVPAPAAEPIAASEPPAASEPLASQSASVAAPESDDTNVLVTPALGGTQGDMAPMVVTKAVADWPRQACIKYLLNVQYGILHGEFGQAEQCWRHDDLRYSVTLKGKAAVLWKQFQIEQESVGRILGGVLVSDVFRETSDNKNYETLFDSVGGKVTQTRNGEVRDVPTGGVALDMLALMHFMSMQPDDVDAFDMFVVASRGTVSRVTVVQQPIQTITLPTGTAIARQFHAEARDGDLKIDVWIARNLRNTPVRFRIDNKGDIFDFQAIDVVADGERLAHRPETQFVQPPNSSDK